MVSFIVCYFYINLSVAIQVLVFPSGYCIFKATNEFNSNFRSSIAFQLILFFQKKKCWEIRKWCSIWTLNDLPERTSTVPPAGPFQVHHGCNRKEYHCSVMHSYQPAAQRIRLKDLYRKSMRIHPKKLPNSISLVVHLNTFGMLVEFYRQFLSYPSIGLMLSVIRSLRSIERPYYNRFDPIVCWHHRHFQNLE